jgi:tryptophanyl-tRNA synthetase
MQPTGEPHLGNLLGAWINWVDMQERAECIYCVVDLHAMTSPAEHDPATLRQRTVDLAASMLAVGIDPERSILFVQSHLPEHAECTWLFMCITGFGELRKMPQFKDKSEGRGESVSAGLLTYPVLQTADILLYHADEVPVGDDQRHHIELARDIGQRFNHRFGEVFTLPKAVHPPAGARVMDLQDPTIKMSKSQSSEKGIVRVLDDPKRIEKKIKSAVTDSGTDIRYDRDEKPGVSNLLEILSGVTGRGVVELAAEHGIPDVPVRGALVFVNAEFGLFSSPFAVDGVWVGWGKAIRKRLAEQAGGALPVDVIAKRLARELRAG